MICPKCGSENVEVFDSRAMASYEGAVRRRRKCFDCAGRWTSYEVRYEEEAIEWLTSKWQADLKKRQGE